MLVCSAAEGAASKRFALTRKFKPTEGDRGRARGEDDLSKPSAEVGVCRLLTLAFSISRLNNETSHPRYP